MRAENVVKIFTTAVKHKKNKPKVNTSFRLWLAILFSIYQHALYKNNTKPSMTDSYDCYQKALAERINGILKQEFSIHKCNNGIELEQLIKESIETYNGKVKDHI